MPHENNSESSDQFEHDYIDEFLWGDEELESRDTRLRKLEDLVRMYRRKSNNAPLSSKGVEFFALWLHRWMLHKVQSREFHERIERDILTATYGEQISRETLSLKRQATEDIAKASKLLHQRLGAPLNSESLGSALEQAYTELRATAKEHPEDEGYRNINSFMERFNPPSWASLQDVARTHLILIEEVAQKANFNLGNTRAKMGQPKKGSMPFSMEFDNQAQR